MDKKGLPHGADKLAVKKKEIRNELGENTISSSSLFAFY
jgi:hypothetical protein